MSKTNTFSLYLAKATVSEFEELLTAGARELIEKGIARRQAVHEGGKEKPEAGGKRSEGMAVLRGDLGLEPVSGQSSNQSLPSVIWTINFAGRR